jgi:hypothetical protein
MRILISESQYKNLLTETAADKALRVLVNKIGVWEPLAKDIVEICGNFSVIMFNKRFNEELSIYSNSRLTQEEKKKIVLKYFNDNANNFFRGFGNRATLVAIMDWVRTGLNGNLGEYKDASIQILSYMSEQWHRSLEVGDAQIDYKEDKDIIIDYREDGLGYYWVSLGVQHCDKESKRMGHCGRSQGFLYSLRQYTSTTKNHTLNKSLLTASIKKDGTLLQLKGPQNSKPKKEYNDFILDLLEYNKDGDYLIKSFGYEYDSKNDFKLSDLNKNEYTLLYQKRPELFKSYSNLKKLDTLGLKKWEGFGKVDVDMYYYSFSPYINFGNSRSDKQKYYLDALASKKILAGKKIYDLQEWWDDQLLNEATVKMIRNILAKRSGKIIDFVNTLDLINRYGNDIKMAIFETYDAIYGLEFINHIKQRIREALAIYGEVTQFNSYGTNDHLILLADLDNFIDTLGVDETIIDELQFNVNDKKSFFERLIEEIYNDNDKDNTKVQLLLATRFKYDQEYEPDEMDRRFIAHLQGQISQINP